MRAEAQERARLDVYDARVLMEGGLTKAKLEELLAGVEHGDLYDVLRSLGASGLAKVAEALSSPAVRRLVDKYGARLELGKEGWWRLVVGAPVEVAIYYEHCCNRDGFAASASAYDKTVAKAEPPEHLEGREWTVEDALRELAEDLRDLAGKIKEEEEAREWLRGAWPGVELWPDNNVSDEARRAAREIEETARAIEEALPPRPQARDEEEREGRPGLRERARRWLARLARALTPKVVCIGADSRYGDYGDEEEW